MEVTHRGCHRFFPRHDDEVFIEIGDALHVTDESEDLWCEGMIIEATPIQFCVLLTSIAKILIEKSKKNVNVFPLLQKFPPHVHVTARTSGSYAVPKLI